MVSLASSVLRGLVAVVLNIALQILAFLALSFVFPTYIEGFQGLIEKGIFRPEEDPRHSWVFVNPLVESILITLASNKFGLHVDLDPSQPLVVRAAKFAFVMSLISAFPGIVLDYTIFQLPGSFPPVWMFCSYLSNFAVALALLYNNTGPNKEKKTQ